jgi:hypothetical protein
LRASASSRRRKAEPRPRRRHGRPPAFARQAAQLAEPAQLAVRGEAQDDGAQPVGLGAVARQRLVADRPAEAEAPAFRIEPLEMPGHPRLVARP